MALPTSPTPVLAPVSPTPDSSAPVRGARIRGLLNGKLGRRLAFVLAGAAAVSGILTYVSLTGSSPFALDPRLTLILLNVDLVLMLALGVVVAWSIVRVWAERRRNMAGSRLHIRFVLMFSVVAVTPAIIVAVFSAIFLNFGLQAWFDTKVSTAIDQSLAVAKAYVREHREIIRADALAMANDINREGPYLAENPQRFNQLVATQAALRSLTEALIFTGSGQIIARSGLSFSLELEPISAEMLELTQGGEVVTTVDEGGDRVRALLQLDRFADTYLLVGRFVDAQVLTHMARTQRAVAEYKRLEGRRSGLQITFSLIFVVVALMLLLTAVWIGLTFAGRLARPLSTLIMAAERVRAGDLTIRVPESPDNDEIASLSRSFNRMTGQLANQRSELIDANLQSETRRRFTEAVLAGVSAGVVGLDQDGSINLPNRSASDLLGIDLGAWIGSPLGEIVPEMAELLAAASSNPGRLLESQIEIIAEGRSRILLVRVTVERDGHDVLGFVVTFDDVTALLSAQRKAAWGDVARRIAHEIKNPLTPIQLSAERLRRKYLSQITKDRETFEICTDTIIRQVGTIGHMVDEFSAFARMPAPVLKNADLAEICRQGLFLERAAHPEIDFKMDFPADAIFLSCDHRLISQAVTNLLRNAVEAIEGRKPGAVLEKGQIWARLVDEDGSAMIVIEDNGKGLPVDQRAFLTDPYVTTREKGTGLGLAIVKKIMEDHDGELRLEERQGGGARVSLIFAPDACVASNNSASEAES